MDLELLLGDRSNNWLSEWLRVLLLNESLYILSVHLLRGGIVLLVLVEDYCIGRALVVNIHVLVILRSLLVLRILVVHIVLASVAILGTFVFRGSLTYEVAEPGIIVSCNVLGRYGVALLLVVEVVHG